mmetsp:Transcript_9871/g.20530  ORF Transcript_9871/g.20530 Transcript_9871/m.20530 type:complete len:200 (-) Transcript_9871:846-1445(-)
MRKLLLALAQNYRPVSRPLCSDNIQHLLFTSRGHRDSDTHSQSSRLIDNHNPPLRIAPFRPEHTKKLESILRLPVFSKLETFSIPPQNIPPLSSQWFCPTIWRRHGTGDNHQSFLRTIPRSGPDTPELRVLRQDRLPNRRNLGTHVFCGLTWLFAIGLCDSPQSIVYPRLPSPKAAALLPTIHRNVPRHRQSRTFQNLI